jgi:hypothetical protein
MMESALKISLIFIAFFVAAFAGDKFQPGKL